MTNSLITSKDKLLQQFLGFLWRQWTASGVPGHDGPRGNWMIDPEALLLATTRVGCHDSRLLDLSIDWLWSNGRRLNLQRLRTLSGQWPVADSRVLSAISQILAEQSAMRKWGTLADTLHLHEEDAPLFVNPDGTPLPVLSDPDPRFRRYQLLRNIWTPRGTSQPPDSSKSCNILHTLRALFGVNARAEIIAWLLTHESGHPAAIARDTGYFSKSVQLTLNDMEQSGHIRSRRDGREKVFWLRRDDWRFLITWQTPKEFPRWINWSPVFYFVTRTLMLLDQKNPDQNSDRLRAIQQRGFLDEMMPALTRSGLAPSMTAHRDLTGTQLTDAILHDVAMLGRLLENDFEQEIIE